MAKATFTFAPASEVSADKAKKIASENDAKVSNFSLNADDGETLTLTGKIFESVWTRKEEGKPDSTGTTLQAESTKKDGGKVYIPFGLFKSARKLASGGQVIECKARFSKDETQTNILDFCKKNATVTVKKYLYFREGFNNEIEITKVL